MANFNLLLQTNAVNERTVAEWIRNMVDSSGGRWGQPEDTGANTWGIRVEEFNGGEDRLRLELENIQANYHGQLEKFQIVPD